MLTDPKDLTVIDGVKLGMNEVTFNAQLDSLKIPQQIFYSMAMAQNLDEIVNSRMKFYSTDIFNSSRFSSAFTHHFGMFYPIRREGTRNIIGLNVLLVHTENAMAITHAGMINVTKETQIPALSQDITSEQTEDIAKMLSDKYGKPTDTMHFYLNSFYVMHGSEIRTYHCDSSNIGDILFWKTKWMDIKLFKGISSPYSTFNESDHSYLTYFESNPFRVINYQNGERLCKSYVYISYELNNDAIKGLGLDTSKL